MQTQTVTVDSNHSAVERLLGFSFAETAGAAAKVELRAGSASGTVVAYLNLVANETATLVLPKPVFIETPGGCYVKQASGSVSGVLYY